MGWSLGLYENGHTALVPTPGRQKQVDLCEFLGQPGLRSELQDNQEIIRPYLKNKQANKQINSKPDGQKLGTANQHMFLPFHRLAKVSYPGKCSNEVDNYGNLRTSGWIKGFTRGLCLGRCVTLSLCFLPTPCFLAAPVPLLWAAPLCCAAHHRYVILHLQC